MIFITLFTLNFLSVYVICTCLYLGTNGIFANVNIDSFHSSSPSQKCVASESIAPASQRSWVRMPLEPPEIFRCQKERVA